MNYQFPPDIDDWIRSRMATGEYSSQDDILRAAKDAFEDREHALDDIRQGIEDLKAGRYRPLRQIDSELRRKYKIPKDD